MLNPYSQKSAFEFLMVFFSRLPKLLMGHETLASDELQIFTLALIAASTGMVGVFLIYRKMTMQANALSHSILFGLALTYLALRSQTGSLENMTFQILFVVAIVTGFITAFLTHLIIRLSRLQKDAAIGLVFTTLFALGIILVSLYFRNTHIGLELVIGNIDAIHPTEMKNIGYVFLLTLLLVFLNFGGLKLSTFDPIYAKMRGLSQSYYHYLVIFLLSVTSIASFRAVGVVLVLSFFIVPPLIARHYVHSLFLQVFGSLIIGLITSFIGVVASRHLLTTYQIALSTAGITVLILYSFFFISLFIKKLISMTVKIKVLNDQSLAPIIEG